MRVLFFYIFYSSSSAQSLLTVTLLSVLFSICLHPYTLNICPPPSDPLVEDQATQKEDGAEKEDYEGEDDQYHYVYEDEDEDRDSEEKDRKKEKGVAESQDDDVSVQERKG